MNVTLIEKNSKLDNNKTASDIEKYENVKQGAELFQPSDQENKSIPKVEMKTAQVKDDKVFHNLFQGFPDTLQDAEVGATPYFSYIVML